MRARAAVVRGRGAAAANGWRKAGQRRRAEMRGPCAVHVQRAWRPRFGAGAAGTFARRFFDGWVNEEGVAPRTAAAGFLARLAAALAAGRPALLFAPSLLFSFDAFFQRDGPLWAFLAQVLEHLRAIRTSTPMSACATSTTGCHARAGVLRLDGLSPLSVCDTVGRARGSMGRERAAEKDACVHGGGVEKERSARRRARGRVCGRSEGRGLPANRRWGQGRHSTRLRCVRVPLRWSCTRLVAC